MTKFCAQQQAERLQQQSKQQVVEQYSNQQEKQINMTEVC